ncbi:hypothetical protein [Streptomyces sp. NPDC093149]|uniref:hypothetical protein n=1 Tax=Streptomyces sp. NPDC093149 TaxID=3366031 RepID=UPI00381D2BDD
MGTHACAVHLNRCRLVAVQPQRCDARQEARILDRHQVTAGKMGVQEPLSGNDRSVRGQCTERLLEILGEVAGGPFGQRLVDGGHAHPGRIHSLVSRSPETRGPHEKGAATRNAIDSVVVTVDSSVKFGHRA